MANPRHDENVTGRGYPVRSVRVSPMVVRPLPPSDAVALAPVTFRTKPRVFDPGPVSFAYVDTLRSERGLIWRPGEPTAVGG